MESNKKSVEIIRIRKDSVATAVDEVVVEHELGLWVNGEHVRTMLCSPSELEDLAVGFLFAEGLISGAGDIKKIEIEGGSKIQATVEKTPFCPHIDKEHQNPSFQFTPELAWNQMKNFAEASKLFQETGGVHSAAICDQEGIRFFAEDIGRHNAVDKAFGKALRAGLEFQNTYFLTSGRIAGDLVRKVIKAGIPIVLSYSAPTETAIRLAEEAGVTLVGFIREERMNVYTGDFRMNLSSK